MNELKVAIYCPSCRHRVFDKLTPTSGKISIKCPRCKEIITIDLSMRKIVKYRKLKKAG